MLSSDVLSRFGEEIDAELNQQLNRVSPSVSSFAKYFFGWVDEKFIPVEDRSGKKLRPTLNLLVYEAIIGDYKLALPLATAIELVHNYSLIHDDVEDRDMERRGRPTLWRIWGDGIAINTGSILYTLAFNSLTELDAPPDKIIKLIKYMTEASVSLSEGQHKDLSFEKMVEVDPNMYLDMIYGKTAALIEYSTFSAAFLASEDPTLISTYKEFGKNLGMAFQIRDDFLNIWGDFSKFGKTTQSDLVKKKKNLPVVYTLSNLSGPNRKKLMDIYGNTGQDMTEGEIKFTLECFESVNARGHTYSTTDQFVKKALTQLDETGIQTYPQKQLHDLAVFLIEREL